MITRSQTDELPILKPDARAAISVSIFVAVLEVISDLIPGIGFLITIPFSIVVYFAQGLLTGKYLGDDPRYPHPGTRDYLRLGAQSGLWTGLLLSPLVSILSLIILTPVTLGTILVGLPVLLVTSLIDLFLNVALTGLGAWIYPHTSGSGKFAISCGLLTAGIICAWLVIAVLVVVLILALLHLFPHIGSLPINPG